MTRSLPHWFWRILIATVVSVLGASMASPVPTAARVPSVGTGRDGNSGASRVIGTGLADRERRAALVRAYAAEFGTSSEQASSELALEDEVGSLQRTLERRERERFAGLWIEHDGGFRVFARFTTGGQAILDAYTAGSALEGRVEAAPADFTLAQLETALTSLRSGTQVAPFDASIDVRANVIVISALSVRQIDEFLAQHGKQLPPMAKVDVVDQLMRPATNIYAGYYLSGACTSGFSVKKVVNNLAYKGIVTAGHCSNTQALNGFNLPFQSEIYNGTVDAQWHTGGPYTPVNRVRTNENGSYLSVTTVAYRASQPVGRSVCKFGRETKWGCGTITDRNVQPNYVPNAQPYYMRVHSYEGVDLVNPGDSGGPVVFPTAGSTASAYGIISGYIGDPSDVIYVASDYVELLGVSIMWY